MPVSRKIAPGANRASITVLVSVEGGPNGLKKLLGHLESLTRLYDLHVIACNNALKSDFSASWKVIQKHGWEYFLSNRKLAPAAYRDWCLQKWATRIGTYNFFLRSGLELPQHFFACAIKTWGGIITDDLGALNLVGESVCIPERVLPRPVVTLKESGKLDACYMVSEQFLQNLSKANGLRSYRVAESLVDRTISTPRTPKAPKPEPEPKPEPKPVEAPVKKKAVFFVATTHRPRLLRACLEHLQKQTVPEGWEYEILVGGEPNDKAKAVVRRMENVRYVDVNNQTVTSKLNALLQAAGQTVDLVLLADDDDIQPIQRLQAACKAYDEGCHWSGVGEVLFYAVNEDRVMKWTGKADQGLVGTSLSFSGELLRKIGGWPERARGKDGPMASAIKKGYTTRPVFKDILKDMDPIVCLQHGSNIWNRAILQKSQRSHRGSFSIFGEGSLDETVIIPEDTKKLLKELRGDLPVPPTPSPAPSRTPPVGRKPRTPSRAAKPRPDPVSAPTPVTEPVPAPSHPVGSELIACTPGAPGQSAFADGLVALGFKNALPAKMEHYLSQGNPVIAHGWQRNYAAVGRKYPGLLHVVWHSGFTGSDLMNEGRALGPALQEAREGCYKLLWLERRDVLLPGMVHMTPVWDPEAMRRLAGASREEKIPNSIMTCFHGEYPANAKNMFATLAACAKSGAELHLGEAATKSRGPVIKEILHGVNYQTYRFLPRAEAVKLASKMTLMVHPSVSDTWPYLVMETVYSGTPVIISEAISWGKELPQWAQETCIARPHTSSRAILQKINLLLKDPKACRRLVKEQQKALDKLAPLHHEEAKKRLKTWGFPIDPVPAPTPSPPPLTKSNRKMPRGPTPSSLAKLSSKQDESLPSSMGLREMIRKAGTAEELQAEIRKLEERVTLKENRPTIMIPSRHRFAARTARILQHLVADYRFVMQTRGRPPVEAALLWALYPFQDGLWAVDAKRQTGLPFLQTLRGQFWHTSQHNRKMAEKCLRAADHIATVANSLWEGVVRNCPDLAGKSHSVIHNGANPLSPDNPSPVEEFPRPVFLCITNFNFQEKRQGIEEMVAALDKAGFTGTYLVAGLPGPFSPPPVIGKCGRNIGYYDNVPGLHRMADVFLYLSYMDAQPSSVMEALLAGMPVVVGDTPFTGTSEFIEEGVTGHCFKTADEGVKIALDLMKDPKRRQKLARNAKKLTGERFTWENAAEAYRNLFERLMKEKP